MDLLNTGSGAWSDTSTWTPARVPGAGDNALLFGGGTVTLAGNGTARQVAIDDFTTLVMAGATLTAPSVVVLGYGSLRVRNGGNAISGLIDNVGNVEIAGITTLAAGNYQSVAVASLAVNDGASLRVASTIVKNGGTISLSSTGRTTTLAVGGTLTSQLDRTSVDYQYTGGTISLSDSAQNLVTTLTGGGILTNVNNVIVGAGTIRAHDFANLEAVGDGTRTGNHAAGLVRASGSDNRLIFDIAAGGTLANAGTMEAQGKAGLQIGGGAAKIKVLNAGQILVQGQSKLVLANADVDNRGGVIRAFSPGAEIDLQDTSIRGGALDIWPYAKIVVTGSSSLTSVSHYYNNNYSSGNYSVVVTAGASFTVRDFNFSVVDATIAAGATASVTDYPFRYDVRGQFLVDGEFFFNGLLIAHGTTIVRGTLSATGGTLRNAGFLGGTGTVVVGALENEGTIRADAADRRMIVEISQSGRLENSGVIEATGTGGLQVRHGTMAGNLGTLGNTGRVTAQSQSSLWLSHFRINNAQGTIEAAAAGAELRLEDSRVSGGRLWTVAGSRLLVGDSSVVTDADVKLGGRVDVTASGDLRLRGGAVTIGGPLAIAGKLGFDTDITLGSGSSHTIDGALDGSGRTLTNVKDRLGGTGTVEVGTLSNRNDGRIEGNLALKVGTALDNAGAITGATITAGKVINSGTMSGVVFRSIAPGAPTVVNEKTGVINAASFDYLTVSNAGTILADGAGRSLVFSGTRLQGGTIGSANGGTIRVKSNASVIDTRLEAQKIASGTSLAVDDGAILLLSNGNAGAMALDRMSITLGSSKSGGTLAFLGNFTLTGNSRINLTEGVANTVGFGEFANVDGVISGAGTALITGTFDNRAGGTIRASGRNVLALEGDGVLRNDGRLDADGGTIRVATGQAVRGSGTVRVTNGGTVDLMGTQAYFGGFQYAGRGTIVGAQAVPGGTISGFATGDTYIFGQTSSLGGPLTTVWTANAGNTGGTLTIRTAGGDTYATLQLAGVYRGADFTASETTYGGGTHVAVAFTGALSWASATSGNWDDAAMWNPSRLVVPGAEDNAVIDAVPAGSGTGTDPAYAVTVSKDTTVGSVATGRQAMLEIAKGTFTTTTGTAVDANAGRIQVSPGGVFVIGGTFGQVSTGQVRAGGAGARIVLGKNATIAGGAVITSTGGVVEASLGGSALSDVAFTNDGSFAVSGGSKYTLTRTAVSGSGLVSVAAGATLAVAGSSIKGNTIDLGGTLEVLGNTTLGGTVQFAGGGRIIAGSTPATLTNDAVIKSAAGLASRIADGNMTLVNTGSILVGNGGATEVATGGNAIQNKGTLAAQGGGSLTISSVVANSGKMIADGVGSRMLSKQAVTNVGEISVTGKAVLDLSGKVTQQAGGRISADGRNTTLKLTSNAGIAGGEVALTGDALLDIAGAGRVGLDDLTLSVDRDSRINIHTTIVTLANSTMKLETERAAGGGLRAAGWVTVAGQDGKMVLQDSTIDGGLFDLSRGGSLRTAGQSVIRNADIRMEGGRILSDGSAARLTLGANITSAGSIIGDRNLTLVNTGTVTARPSGDVPGVTLETGGNAILNQGVLEAAAVGTRMAIGSILTNDVSGVLRAGAGGSVVATRVDNAGHIEVRGTMEIQGGLFNRADLLVSGGGVLDSLYTDNAGEATVRGAGSRMTLGNVSNVTRNSGRVQAIDGGVAVFEKGVENQAGGQLVAKDGGRIVVEGAATGGVARIVGDGAVMDFEGSAKASTITLTEFGGTGNGRLVLGNSSRFAGTVAGMSAGDGIEVKDIAFTAGDDFYDSATKVLTVSDGIHTSRIQMIGTYAADQFVFAADGHGGTLVTIASGTPATLFAHA